MRQAINVHILVLKALSYADSNAVLKGLIYPQLLSISPKVMWLFGDFVAKRDDLFSGLFSLTRAGLVLVLVIACFGKVLVDVNRAGASGLYENKDKAFFVSEKPLRLFNSSLIQNWMFGGGGNHHPPPWNRGMSVACGGQPKRRDGNSLF